MVDGEEAHVPSGFGGGTHVSRFFHYKIDDLDDLDDLATKQKPPNFRKGVSKYLCLENIIKLCR
jgi:hypothetical protein